MLLRPSANADTLVVPNYAKDVDANAADGALLTGTGTRLQNIYNASQFLIAMPEGAIITQIAFRVDESQRNSLTTIVPSVEIHMSTSPVSANSLSRFFSANTGPDETVVFSSHPVSVTITGSKSGPNPFQIIFPLQTPFFYDPRRGSLSLDISSQKGAFPGLVLDASGDRESVALAGPIGSTSSDFPGAALVTELTFQPVPEVKSWQIFVFGAGLLTLARGFRCVCHS